MVAESSRIGRGYGIDLGIEIVGLPIQFLDLGILHQSGGVGARFLVAPAVSLADFRQPRLDLRHARGVDLTQ
jgi:hypothetical protein